MAPGSRRSQRRSPRPVGRECEDGLVQNYPARAVIDLDAIAANVVSATSRVAVSGCVVALILTGCTATAPQQAPTVAPSLVEEGVPVSPGTKGGSIRPEHQQLPDGNVRMMSASDRLSSPIGAGVLGEAQTFESAGGIIAGSAPNDGFVIAYAPHPPAEEVDLESLETFRTGVGILVPGEPIEWVLPVPEWPTPGPGISEATVSSEWIVWLENDSNYLENWPYRMWARSRDGGEPRLLAESTPGPDGNHVAPPGYNRTPQIIGDRVYWVDTLHDDEGVPGSAVMSASIEHAPGARVDISGGAGLHPDLCAENGDLAFYYARGGFGGRELPAMHRRVVDIDGEVISDTVVWQDAAPESKTAREVGVCGETVATVRETDTDADDFATWIEIATPQGARSYVWPEGSGTSLTSLTVTPDVVTWAAFNGVFEGSRYVYSIARDELFELPIAPGLSRLYANRGYVQWSEHAGAGAEIVDYVAPILRASTSP